MYGLYDYIDGAYIGEATFEQIYASVFAGGKEGVIVIDDEDDVLPQETALQNCKARGTKPRLVYVQQLY